MKRNSKTTVALLFSLLFAAVISLTAFTAPVSAEEGDGAEGVEGPKTVYMNSVEAFGDDDYDDGIGVHADPATFEKNYCLSVEEKEKAITTIEDFVSAHINPDMSDLEKYYTLARYENEHVKYDWNFWSGGYRFDYYSHQWDAYGVMVEQNAVCVGIAITYANLCHAADLPCKFLRTDPAQLDHTICYIPDINGNAYYADVTENMFLMSKATEVFVSIADKEFAHIKKECKDGSFEYRQKDEDDDVTVKPAALKFEDEDTEQVFYKPYDQWFCDSTWHEGTDKDFVDKYVEKGSGLRPGETGYKHASYKDYPKQYSDFEKPKTVWFLEDFYQDPEDAASKIMAKELDEQFLCVSGLKKNYDCDTIEELEAAVNHDISISYFPSVSGGNIVAEYTPLTKDSDYQVSYKAYDDATHEAEFTVKATDGGAYKGSSVIRVKMNASVVEKAPVGISELIYTGSEQKLVKPGVAENGTMVYAACKKGASEPKYYFEEIPTGVNAGRYDVWYKVIGDDNHFSTKAQRMDRAAKIAPHSLFGANVVLSNTAFAYNAKVQKPSVKSIDGIKVTSGTDYTASWSDASSKNPGEYTVTIEGKGNFADDTDETYFINKGANPMTLKGKTVKVKRSKVKKKARTIKRAKAFTVSKARGKLTYKLVSAKKGKKSFKKKFKINAKTGNVTAKKGLKKGTYKVKVKVKAAGNANYKASAWKAVTFKVRVK